MKTTLIKLATTSAMALVVTSTAAIPADAASRHPVQSSPAPIPQTICKVSGILGWFGGMVGGNDVCGDNYDDQPYRSRNDHAFPEVSI
ncbi:hypothetical protein [Streptomyces purpurascens]|uniref:Uncharacterized protein n=1 Tax=Streptomyces purpurascens TaxID=1924 RepID=A0ABZ1MY80_STREF|nr:hypothetical protein [Streptomyces purpurascens]MCE7053015.1 hypothetical protein [Streptomyces purpurascens]GHA55957.1 hypothetical protein GCM10010303_79780 [Streptomyces purpurascens]